MRTDGLRDTTSLVDISGNMPNCLDLDFLARLQMGLFHLIEFQDLPAILLYWLEERSVEELPTHPRGAGEIGKQVRLFNRTLQSVYHFARLRFDKVMDHKEHVGDVLSILEELHHDFPRYDHLRRDQAERLCRFEATRFQALFYHLNLMILQIRQAAATTPPSPKKARQLVHEVMHGPSKSAALPVVQVPPSQPQIQYPNEMMLPAKWYERATSLSRGTELKAGTIRRYAKLHPELVHSEKRGNDRLYFLPDVVKKWTTYARVIKDAHQEQRTLSDMKRTHAH